MANDTHFGDPVTKTYFSDKVILPRANSNSIFPTNLSSSYNVTVSKVATGYDNPAWKKQIALKQNATTPRDMEIRTIVKAQPANFRKTIQRTSDKKIGTLIETGFLNNQQPVFGHPAIDFTPARSAAYTHAYAKVSDRSRHGQCPVLLGEISQTLRMLRNPLEALHLGLHNYLKAVEYKSLKANIRGINQDGRRRIIQSIVSDTWLEFQFGWRPLFMDVNDIFTALRAYSTSQELAKVSDVYRAHYDSPVFSGANNIAQGSKLIENDSKETTLAIYSHVGLLPGIDPSFEKLQVGLGFDSLNFIPTLYELIPWSFVVDYFTTVGDVINTAFAVTDNIAWTSQTEVIETLYHMRVRDSLEIAAGYTILSVDVNVPGAFTFSTKTLKRVTNLQYPTFNLKRPSFLKKLNLVALALSHNRTSYRIRGA